ncbi:hypothetical protein A3C20_04865 [Candidatus Kaiserbacteria bacterium RIFCSPHIGHO2_02_FULL_55_25]|uniref:DUF1905 domain-containing protein n=1 Tax=Candidatus Kaiserbacteria bacterium RIFCSPHIGHO2_02_FULL_55_25 TaxID=1798498 RepID=A0A1F6E5T0_9BACT|nr:MAG: hypothetical protein A2764_02650 [Candidatus Kaiserbacteria bacterium RIFCSPHIGHO2_01_FULL_55_79]OGG69049.1 MAG: hypothetical protein A3C20_04865 [Candidatus Kaiserbacteria bacterium RIFCSPHIGHO2_02_FULL_55_25]OGG77008.1 MAG: hypothetical protein A3F56_01875 [Candidatus Kaiserbacteria bacterium RIFCSPHIGHO2_12_FULL_55_13]
MTNRYKVRSEVTLWPGAQGAWHFAYVDKTHSEEIRKKYTGPRRGFGAVRVGVRVGKTAWETSIFPDSRSGVYILPLKAKVRRAEGIQAGDTIALTLTILA